MLSHNNPNFFQIEDGCADSGRCACYSLRSHPRPLLCKARRGVCQSSFCPGYLSSFCLAKLDDVFFNVLYGMVHYYTSRPTATDMGGCETKYCWFLTNIFQVKYKLLFHIFKNIFLFDIFQNISSGDCLEVT